MFPSFVLMLTLACGVLASAQLPALTDQQIEEAIALGKNKSAPVARAEPGRDFDVYIEGPIGRIAAAAEKASKERRPFDKSNVTDLMKEPVYRVYLVETKSASSRQTIPGHIVLITREFKYIEAALQPIRQTGRVLETGRVYVSEAYFDRLPEGELDVAVGTNDGLQRFRVDATERQKIR